MEQAPNGVTVDLSGKLAERLGVALELVAVDGAAKSVDAVTNERAGVGFFAIDPQCGAGIAFTPAYALIEGCYLVRGDSPKILAHSSRPHCSTSCLRPRHTRRWPESHS